MNTYLVTGAAGFIGYHLAKVLVERGNDVVGVDNLSEYYSVKLKRDRLDQLSDSPRFRFERIELSDGKATEALFRANRFQVVLHMAAQAGVRYSLKNPQAYVDSNVRGFLNVLECCRTWPPQHLVYASSSSVYGANEKLPFSVDDSVDRPISLYAATKRSDELMAYTYSHLYQLRATGLRFFTVYGPWGRPDMALYIFADAISAGRPIELFNNGKMQRDFTYIDDIVEGVLRVADQAPIPVYDETDPGKLASPPHRLYNIGNHQPVELESVVALLENGLGKKATRSYVPMQAGEVIVTYADVASLQAAVGFRPTTPIEVGVARFVEWYRRYHG